MLTDVFTCPRPCRWQPAGTTEIPFEFVLKPLTGSQLHDTYHGVYVNVRYTASAEMPRGMFSNALKNSKEFIVELARDKAVHEKVRRATRESA